MTLQSLYKNGRSNQIPLPIKKKKKKWTQIPLIFYITLGMWFCGLAESTTAQPLETLPASQTVQAEKAGNYLGSLDLISDQSVGWKWGT